MRERLSVGRCEKVTVSRACCEASEGDKNCYCEG